MQYPPKTSNERNTQSMFSAPKKYPTIDENKTLIDKRNFVISLKRTQKEGRSDIAAA
jgi:hypothetical protein